MIDLSGSSRHPGYDDALAWLFARNRGGAPRNAERMRRLIDLRGLRPPPRVVHVVGSNGKGTVAAMIAAGLAGAGRRSGLFTSPHVEDYRERISVLSAAISEAEVVGSVQRMRQDAALSGFGFFELTLVLALEHFARHEVEIAVIEAGIGARNDASNAVGNVVMTVLTNVALDHQAVLGDSVAAIAADKLAAVRAAVPVVCGFSGAEAEAARERADAVAAPLYLEIAGGALFTPPAPLAAATDPAIRQNRRLASAALRLLRVPEAAVAAALLSPALPARRERFTVRGRSVLLDGAHDPEAARVLRLSLRRRYVLVFASLARKQGQTTFEVLADAAQSVVVTEAEPGVGRPPWSEGWPFEAEPVAALERALALCPADAVVLVTGSLYLAGRVRPFLRSHHRS